MHNEQHFLIKTAFIIVYLYHSSLVITFFFGGAGFVCKSMNHLMLVFIVYLCAFIFLGVDFR